MTAPQVALWAAGIRHVSYHNTAFCQSFGFQGSDRLGRRPGFASVRFFLRGFEECFQTNPCLRTIVEVVPEGCDCLFEEVG